MAGPVAITSFECWHPRAKPRKYGSFCRHALFIALGNISHASLRPSLGTDCAHPGGSSTPWLPCSRLQCPLATSPHVFLLGYDLLSQTPLTLILTLWYTTGRVYRSHKPELFPFPPKPNQSTSPTFFSPVVKEMISVKSLIRDNLVTIKFNAFFLSRTGDQAVE